MSNVTNVIITTSVSDSHNLGKLNATFRYGSPFVACASPVLPIGWYAGDKHLECEVYIGAFNYFKQEDLVCALTKIEWDCPDSVQLFVKGQDDEKMREVILEGLRQSERYRYGKDIEV